MKSTRTVTSLLPIRSQSARRSLLALSVLAAALSPGLVHAQTPPCGLPPGTAIYGMTADNRIVEYVVPTQNVSGTTLPIGSIVTKAADAITSIIDSPLVGIDFRPADNNEANLYAVTDRGEIRLFNPFPGRINSDLLTAAVSNPAVPFQGGLHTTMDFNPVLDAVRLVGSNDQNFAVVNSAGGNLNAFAQQTALRYATGDAAAGVDPNITTGAYDNNFPGATRTTFYMLDYSRDTLVTIADRTATGSSNTGGGMLKTIGNLVEPNGTAINVSAGSGLDIVTTGDGRNIAVGYTGNRLFCVDLATVNADLPVGTTRNVTAIPLRRNPFVQNGAGFLPTNEKFIDIAIPPRSPVSADGAVSIVRKGSTSTVARLGDTVSFSVTVLNNGPSIANGLQLNVGATQSNVGMLEITQGFIAGGGSCARSGIIGMVAQVTCALPALRNGAQLTVSFDAKTIRPSSNPGGVTLTGSANLTGQVPDPNTANNTASRVINLSF